MLLQGILGLVLEFSEAAEQNILALLLMVLLPYLLHFISPWVQY